jgi:hypothetical protein
MSLILSGTDGLSDVDGSAATPAIRGTDANTGIFFPAADTIAFAEGGAECARFDSSGNFGLGVTPTNNTLGKTVQVGQSTVLTADASANRFWLGSNWYYNSGDKYIANGFSTLYSQQSGTHQWFNAPSGTAGNAITFTQAMTLDASGNLLVGATSADARVFAYSTTGTSLKAQNPSNVAQLLIGYNNTSFNYIDADNNIFRSGAGVERARIDSSGNLLVGSSTSLYASGKLQISGGKTIINSTDSSFGQLQLGNATSNSEVSIQFISGVAAFGNPPTSTSSDNFCWNMGAGNYGIGGDSFGVANKGNGGINVKLAYNSSSWISVSDERIKDIQSDITNAYEIVKDWRTVYYTLKSDPLKIIKIGLLAQDVQKTLPAAVDIPKTETDDKGKLNPWGVHYTDVIPVLVKAIQEQQALITQLTARITALESA